MAWWNCPGPGDESTWPPYGGDPNDPRCPDDGTEDPEEGGFDDFDPDDFEDMGDGRMMRRFWR